MELLYERNPDYSVGPGRPMGSVVYGLILRESRELLYRIARWESKIKNIFTAIRVNRQSLDL